MNVAAERLRRLGIPARLLNEIRAAERKATVERIVVQVDEYVTAFPNRNRTVLYGAALALRERLAQMAEQDAILDAEAER